MEHSLQAYIERLSTEQLENFLNQYYDGKLAEDFTYVVPYIEYIIDRRKANMQ